MTRKLMIFPPAYRRDELTVAEERAGEYRQELAENGYWEGDDGFARAARDQGWHVAVGIDDPARPEHPDFRLPAEAGVRVTDDVPF